MKYLKTFVVIGLSGALMLGSGTANATAAGYVQSTSRVAYQISIDEELIDQTSEKIIEGFKILDEAIYEDSDGYYQLNEKVLESHSVSSAEIDDARLYVRYMNAGKRHTGPVYRDRSWTSFGLCVVSTFTGFQVPEIRKYVNWKSFGYYIRNRDWVQALNALKSGVRMYMAKHGAKVAGRVALKQIINASGVGFAAQAGVAAISCGILEGWSWFWS